MTTRRRATAFAAIPSLRSAPCNLRTSDLRNACTASSHAWWAPRKTTCSKSPRAAAKADLDRRLVVSVYGEHKDGIYADRRTGEPDPVPGAL